MDMTIDSTLKNKVSGTTEKGLGRAQDILQAARTLLAEEGYAGLSMRRVAQAAGFAKWYSQFFTRVARVERTSTGP